MMDELRLRVVSWNIHSCVGRRGRYDPERVACVLSELDADVIGLQEVDWRSPDHEDSDQFSYLAGALGMTPIAGPNLRDHHGHYGNGLLTRLGVEQVRRIELAHERREPRGAIDAILNTDGVRVQCIVTHLGLKRSERETQLRTIRRVIEEDDPVDVRLLLGDINEWAPHRAPERILTPSPFARVLGARSFPSRMPMLRLDRIFVWPEPVSVLVEASREGDARRASDHLPVVADLSWAIGAEWDRHA